MNGYTLDRTRFDAYDREATRQQAINAANRCFFAAWWLSLLGDEEGAERYLKYIRELTAVIVGTPGTPTERSSHGYL